MAIGQHEDHSVNQSGDGSNSTQAETKTLPEANPSTALSLLTEKPVFYGVQCTDDDTNDYNQQDCMKKTDVNSLEAKFLTPPKTCEKEILVASGQSAGAAAWKCRSSDEGISWKERCSSVRAGATQNKEVQEKNARHCANSYEDDVISSVASQLKSIGDSFDDRSKATLTAHEQQPLQADIDGQRVAWSLVPSTIITVVERLRPLLFQDPVEPQEDPPDPTTTG